uniref:Uncharacterized protein n=1 Tax=Rhizophora mucronata TaxID=61149 RepID=A0A2P2PXC3_RHIMU
MPVVLVLHFWVPLLLVGMIVILPGLLVQIRTVGFLLHLFS